MHASTGAAGLTLVGVGPGDPQLLTVAAVNGIDACPMEGFDPAKFDEILGLKEKGLRSVVVCPVGMRSADDKYASAKKIRYPESDVIVKIA